MSFKNNIKPLLEKGGPFDEKQLLMLRLWAEQGAVWDEGVAFRASGGPGAAEAAGAGAPPPEPKTDKLELVREIHAHIVAGSPEKTEADMKEYTATIPGLEAKYTMIPIKGGEFTMGSPEGEANRGDDEGPQHTVKLDPFWMGKYEVTWDEYLHFMLPEDPRNKDGSLANPKPDATIVDLVARPTEPYQDMSFGMGQDGYPAICMTQHAANKFCEWLSAKTGHFYRLPTEAEWEYACRAGTTTAYSFGDDPKGLDEHAWYFANSNFQYQKIGGKKPNPWGLHDMHGNVLEWTIDQYLPNAYEERKDGSLANPWVKSTTPYPHVARGGSWDDDPEQLRSAVRRASNEDWKMQDPQLPKSIWYHTDAVWLGFRIVRPLATPSPEEMQAFWYNGVEND
jgi:formylglycine-generating enzyme required for sulfatase activity